MGGLATFPARLRSTNRVRAPATNAILLRQPGSASIVDTRARTVCSVAQGKQRCQLPRSQPHWSQHCSVQEALYHLHERVDGQLGSGERLSLLLSPYRLVKDKLPINPDCFAHDTLPAKVESIDVELKQTTISETILRAWSTCPKLTRWNWDSTFSQNSVAALRSPLHQVLKPKEKVFQDQAGCPHCGAMRLPQTISAVALSSPQAEIALGQIGLPPREIVSFRGNSRQALFATWRVVPIHNEEGPQNGEQTQFDNSDRIK